jgi:formate dehydrogenase subunit gamma
MAQTLHETGADPAILRAATEEDVVIGQRIVRHKLSSRFLHWSVAATFILTLLSGLPIWTPIFHWMSGLFGGLAVCRWLHPLLGCAFFGFSLLLFFAWFGDMRFEKGDGAWFGPRMVQYFMYKGEDVDSGKYNGGQKIYFFMVTLLALIVFLSGFVLWYPMEFTTELRQISVVVHDAAFILFASSVVVHIYLSTAMEPGTFGSMTHGSVSKTWARFHHPRWFRQVTGERSDRDRDPRN